MTRRGTYHPVRTGRDIYAHIYIFDITILICAENFMY